MNQVNDKATTRGDGVPGEIPALMAILAGFAAAARSEGVDVKFAVVHMDADDTNGVAGTDTPSPDDKANATADPTAAKQEACEKPNTAQAAAQTPSDFLKYLSDKLNQRRKDASIKAFDRGVANTKALVAQMLKAQHDGARKTANSLAAGDTNFKDSPVEAYVLGQLAYLTLLHGRVSDNFLLPDDDDLFLARCRDDAVSAHKG